MIAAATLALLLGVLPARAENEPIECPAGKHRVSTDNPYEPFRCVDAATENRKGFDAVVGPKGFASRPHCPHGTHPVAAEGASLQAYRCVRTTGGADPELSPIGAVDGGAAAPADAGQDALTKGCPRGQRKVRTNDPLEPYQCVSQASRMQTLSEGSYAHFSIPRQISFDYATVFRVQDAWKEEVPTLYLKIDDGAAGKPVTITITRNAESQSTYQEMSEAISHDVEWQGAKDGGSQLVGRTRARVTYIPGDTRSVYLPSTKDSYYSFVYSAPADKYENYLPAFTRLLKNLIVPGTEQ